MKREYDIQGDVLCKGDYVWFASDNKLVRGKVINVLDEGRVVIESVYQEQNGLYTRHSESILKDNTVRLVKRNG